MLHIVQCGIPRSGSTLVWQILNAVFSAQTIPKTHPDTWDADGSFVVPTIRDPYDVVASLVRVRLSREGKKEIEDEDVHVVLDRTKFCFDKMKEILDGPCAPVLRYEEFYNNYSLVHEMIDETFGVMTTPESQEKINSNFSLERNRDRASVLKDFYQVDKDQIHGDHIGHVIPGYWIDYFPEKYIQTIKTKCAPLRVEWNYE